MYKFNFAVIYGTLALAAVVLCGVVAKAELNPGGQALVTVGTHTMTAELRTVGTHSVELIRSAPNQCLDVKVEFQSGDPVLLSERVWNEDDNGIATRLHRAHPVWRGKVCGVLYAVAEHYAEPD